MKSVLQFTSALIIVAILLLLGVRWAERGDRLDLTTARIDNSFLVDSASIALVLKPYMGCSLLKLDKDSLQMDLMALEGVDSVSIRIRYPETVIISFQTGKPAFVLDYGESQIPVTSTGKSLPYGWANSELPSITIVEPPDSGVIESAIDLFLKRGFDHSVLVQVYSQSIVVTENGVRVILDPDRAVENWQSWRTISPLLTRHTDEVDLRFGHQAVMRSAEET